MQNECIIATSPPSISSIQKAATAQNVAGLEHAVTQTPKLSRFNRKNKQPQKLISPTRGKVGNTLNHGGAIAIVVPQMNIASASLSGTPRDVEDSMPVLMQTNPIAGDVSTPTSFRQIEDHILRSRKRGGPMPKRFVKAIQKQKLREETVGSIKAITPQVHLASGTTPNKGEQKHENVSDGSQREISTSHTTPITDEDDENLEPITLEAAIRTSISRKRPLSTSENMALDLSFGPSRSTQDSDDSGSEFSDSENSLDNLEKEILDLADVVDDVNGLQETRNDSQFSSTFRPPDDSDLPDTQRDFDCTTQEDVLAELMDIGRTKKERSARKTQKTYSSGAQRGQNNPQVIVNAAPVEAVPNSPSRSRKPRVRRRLPIEGELNLVSHRLEMSDEEDLDDEIPLELIDDPISQVSDADQIEENRRAPKSNKQLPQAPINYPRPFGIIDPAEYRILKPESKRRRWTAFSCSDGFVGREALPIGILMPIPKPKRARHGISGSSLCLGRLTLVESRDDDQSIQQTNRYQKLRTKNKSQLQQGFFSKEQMVEILPSTNATPLVQIDGQERTSKLIQQDKQPIGEIATGDDDMTHMPMMDDFVPPQRLKSLRRVTFDNRVEVDPRSRLTSTDSETFDCSKILQEDSDSEIQQEMAMVSIKRRYESSEDESSSNEFFDDCIDKDQEILEDDTEDSDKCSEESSVNTSERDSDEDEVMSEDNDITRLQPAPGDNITRILHAKPCDLELDETLPASPRDMSQEDSQAVELNEPHASEDQNEYQLSQLSQSHGTPGTPLSIDRTGADIWRPRRPHPSTVANETEEDIDDSPTLHASQRRRSFGLIGRQRTRSRPLSLTASRPVTPEIPETQVVEECKASPEPEESQTCANSPEIPETQIIEEFRASPEIGDSQAFAETSSPSGQSMLGNQPFPIAEEDLPRFSQLSYIPEPQESYYGRATKELGESFRRMKVMRSKSTPARSHPDYLHTATQLIEEPPSNQIFQNANLGMPFSQNVATPRPGRNEVKSLKDITRQASSSLGMLHGSARKRMKSLPFVPPFKK